MQIKTLLLLFVAITLYSCKKDNNPLPDPGGSYLLTKEVSETASKVSGRSAEFFYKDNKLVSEIVAKRWFTVSTNGVSEIGTYLNHYIFEYADSKLVKVTDKARDGNVYWIYEYDDRGLPIKASFYSDTLLASVKKYSYNSAGQLVESSDSAYGSFTRTTFEYNAQNNLERMIEYTSFIEEEKYMHEFGGYDDHESVYSMIPGFPDNNTLNLDFNFKSANNPTITTVYKKVPVNEAFQESYVVKEIYEYNEAGLPVTKRTEDNSSITTYEYRRVD